jgi:hypothetical protein
MALIFTGEPDDPRPDSPSADSPDEAAAPSGTTAPAPTLTRLEKRVAAASIVAGGLLTMLILMMRAGASASPPSDPVAVPAPGPATAVSAAAAADSGPAWTDGNSETWIGTSRRAVAYEVPADKPVSVWMRTVRPALVVRCERNILDVFVFTDSAARIERDTPDHTVRYRFDEGQEESGLWPDADSHDALFAPDGAAFARRLAQARTLQFGFTPHNAEPVTMRFPVAGLAPLLVRAAKDGCRPALP